MADDTRWLTYTELAAELGIKRDSAIRLVRRKGWPRRHGNGPRDIRAAIPGSVLADIREGRHTPDITGYDTGSVSGDMPRAIRALETALADLREQLGRERDRADQVEHGRQQDRAAAAEREAAAQARADRAEQRAEQAQARADRIEAAAVRREPLTWGKLIRRIWPAKDC